MGRLGGKVTSEAKAAAVRENGKMGGRPGLFQLVEIFTMSGDGQAALFRSADGREMRVDFFDRERLEEYGQEANIEVYGIGRGWETPEGRPVHPKLRKYMIDAILAA